MSKCLESASGRAGPGFSPTSGARSGRICVSRGCPGTTDGGKTPLSSTRQNPSRDGETARSGARERVIGFVAGRPTATTRARGRKRARTRPFREPRNGAFARRKPFHGAGPAPGARTKRFQTRESASARTRSDSIAATLVLRPLERHDRRRGVARSRFLPPDRRRRHARKRFRRRGRRRGAARRRFLRRDRRRRRRRQAGGEPC